MTAIHPQVRTVLDAEPGGPPPADLAAQRAAYLETTLRLGGAAEPVADVTELVIPSGDARLRAALYAPLHAPEAAELIVWLHGGGWVFGDIATFDRVARSLANAAGAKVLLPEYRLVPEQRWPVPVQDAIAVSRWARGAAGAEQLGVDPAHVALGGDSAGGQLAAVAVRHGRDDELPAPSAQLLAYPALDPTMGSAAYREFAEGTGLTAEDMRASWELYLDGRGAGDPDAAPLLAADLTDLPPTYVGVAGHDPLRDDGLRYAELLRTAGVPVQAEVFDDMVHGFLRWGGVVDRTRELIAGLAGAARDSWAPR